jgi:hypothetical protein
MIYIRRNHLLCSEARHNRRDYLTGRKKEVWKLQQGSKAWGSGRPRMIVGQARDVDHSDLLKPRKLFKHFPSRSYPASHEALDLYH